MGKKLEWTLDKANSLLDGLEEWMMKDVPLYYKGKQTGTAKLNVFWKEFLYEQKVFPSVISHIRQMYPSIDDRLKYFEAIQEERLASLAFRGLGKEQMAKFLLMAKYGYKERVDNTTTHISKDFNINDLIGFEDEENTD